MRLIVALLCDADFVKAVLLTMLIMLTSLVLPGTAADSGPNGVTVEDANGVNMFIPAGLLEAEIGDAHIHFEIDLGRIRSRYVDFLKSATDCLGLDSAIRGGLASQVNGQSHVVLDRIDNLMHIANTGTLENEGNIEKRSFIMSAVQFLFGGINTYKISKLQDEVKRAKNAEHEAIITTIRAENHHIRDNEVNIAALAKFANSTNSRVDQMAFDLHAASVANGINSRWHQIVEAIEDAFTKGLAGKVSVAFFTYDMLVEATGELKKQLGEKSPGASLVDLSTIWQMPAMLAPRGKGKADSFIHIPVVDTGRSSVLYKHLPVPWVEAGKVWTLDGGAEYIAIDKWDASFYTLSKEDLEACSKTVSSHYFCRTPPLLRKCRQKSCLASLFYDDQEGIRKSCMLTKIDDEISYAESINGSAVLMFSESSIKGDIFCGNETGSIWTRGFKVVNLPAACELRTSDFNFRSMFEIETTLEHNLTAKVVNASRVMAEMEDMQEVAFHLKASSVPLVDIDEEVEKARAATQPSSLLI